jgi:hypothetical protein
MGKMPMPHFMYDLIAVQNKREFAVHHLATAPVPDGLDKLSPEGAA